MSRLFNTPQEVADALPKEISKKWLAKYGEHWKNEPFHEPLSLPHAIVLVDHMDNTEQEQRYWWNIQERVRAGEFDPKGEEPKGVFVDIKVNAELPMPSLAEIKDQVAKEIGYDNWSSYEYSLIDYNQEDWSDCSVFFNNVAVVHERYASAKISHERQRAERAEAEIEKKARLLESAASFLRIGDGADRDKLNALLLEIDAALAEKGGSDAGNG